MLLVLLVLVLLVLTSSFRLPIGVLYCAVVYYKCYTHFSATIEDAQMPPAAVKRMKKVFLRMGLYPLILVLQWTPAACWRAWEFITVATPPLWLHTMAVLGWNAGT